MLQKGSSKLPWSGSTSNEHGLEIKKNTSLETLYSPAGMLEYMKAVRAMGYAHDPDYDALDAVLGSLTSAKRERPAMETPSGSSRPVKPRRSPRDLS